jgi:hypothetical protein
MEESNFRDLLALLMLELGNVEKVTSPVGETSADAPRYHRVSPPADILLIEAL